MKIPNGFKGGAVAAGLKPSGADDLAVILSDRPCTTSAVFTKNKFAGPNLQVSKRHLAIGPCRGVVINAGQANACTGAEGEAVAIATAQAVAKLSGCKPNQLLVASTGVIGVLPDLSKIEAGLERMFENGLKPDSFGKVSRAMMTTDTKPKTAEASLRVGGKQIRILGMVKGSGMIHPNMGTLLSFITTDVSISKRDLNTAFATAVDSSFHCLTVDGDTSTSDMVAVFANGAAENEKLLPEELVQFTQKLTAVCCDLAKQVAADGEGASKLVRVRVLDAATFAGARQVAMTVASSSLVKTAIFGRDPNWGRIACAVGYSGVEFEPDEVVIKIGRTRVFSKGKPASTDLSVAEAYLSNEDEIDIIVTLGTGKEKATVWTSDLTHGYISINADYTT